MASITAILQLTNTIKVLPIAASLELAEIYLLDWYIYVYALAIPLLSIIFSLIVRALMKEYQNKYQELESLAFKLAKYLSPQVYASIFQGANDVHIQTYRKKLSIFFSELNGFTQTTENMDSEQLSKNTESLLKRNV